MRLPGDDADMPPVGRLYGTDGKTKIRQLVSCRWCRQRLAVRTRGHAQYVECALCDAPNYLTQDPYNQPEGATL